MKKLGNRLVDSDSESESSRSGESSSSEQSEEKAKGVAHETTKQETEEVAPTKTEIVDERTPPKIHAKAPEVPKQQTNENEDVRISVRKD